MFRCVLFDEAEVHFSCCEQRDAVDWDEVIESWNEKIGEFFCRKLGAEESDQLWNFALWRCVDNC